MPLVPTTPYPSRVCLTSAFAFSQGQGGSALGGGSPCLERQRQGQQGSFRELAALPRGLVTTHSAETVTSPLLHFRPGVHIPQNLFWRVFQEPPPLLTPLWTKPCVCVCVCMCVCIFPQQRAHLAGQAPQTEGKVWMAQQIQELGLRRRGWGEVKIIAQFQACSRLSEFHNP